MSESKERTPAEARAIAAHPDMNPDVAAAFADELNDMDDANQARREAAQDPIVRACADYLQGNLNGGELLAILREGGIPKVVVDLIGEMHDAAQPKSRFQCGSSWMDGVKPIAK